MIDNAIQEKEPERHLMVETQIAGRGIKDTYVLEAMRAVPREMFMPVGVDELAYEDMPLPIEEDQTISQPYIVALMAELAQIHPDDRVLEIGAGSGYAAAVISLIAEHVYTIERHESLAMRAENILSDLGYDNVSVIHGDGSLGLPVEAPFDVIMVTAGAPEVPESLKAQLSIGGRLIIPVGGHERQQNMMRLIKLPDGDFKIENHGPVAFVPLIGRQGWFKNNSITRKEPENKSPIVKLLEHDAQALPAPDSPHFGQFFDHLGEADIVLLGESTHGTAEFYRARAAITQRLILKHGFKILALEADYPDVSVLDGFVRNRDVPDIGKPVFARFPEWMWRNDEFLQFVSWIKAYNESQADPENMTGIYGIDIYGLQSSINAVIDFLKDKDPQLAELARMRYSCFEPWWDDLVNYGSTMLTEDYKSCEEDVVKMLKDVLLERQTYTNGYADNYLDITRNATLIANAEKYYRTIFMSSAASWNLRDEHMFNTLCAIRNSRFNSSGAPAKTVVWAHNSHIGDARASDMGVNRDEINLGQLCRENFGDKVQLVGFGTASGTVAAADYWGGSVEIKNINTPMPGSYEDLWSETSFDYAKLSMKDIDDKLREKLAENFMQRAIGVIYKPESEMMSHYYNARPAKQFDHYVWMHKTAALTPLPQSVEQEELETYPFGI